MSLIGWQNGRRIRELRSDRGLSVGEFAELIRMNRQALSNLELNNKQCRLDTLIRIARELDVPLDEVVRRSLDEDDEQDEEQAA